MTFSKNLGKIRQQRNLFCSYRSVVYKEARILCFEDGNNFSDVKSVRENSI